MRIVSLNLCGSKFPPFCLLRKGKETTPLRMCTVRRHDLRRCFPDEPGFAFDAIDQPVYARIWKSEVCLDSMLLLYNCYEIKSQATLLYWAFEFEFLYDNSLRFIADSNGPPRLHIHKCRPALRPNLQECLLTCRWLRNHLSQGTWRMLPHMTSQHFLK